MTTFYCTVDYDETKPPENFSIEAPDMLTATRLIAAYLKGHFEGSGQGGEISHIGRTKARGQTYRGL